MHHHAHARSWFPLQVLSRSYLQKICDKRRMCARGFYSSRVKKNKGALEGKGQNMRGKKQTSGTGVWTTNKNTWTRLKSLYSNLGSLQNNKTRTSFNLECFYWGTKISKHESLKFALSSFELQRKFMDQNPPKEQRCWPTSRFSASSLQQLLIYRLLDPLIHLCFCGRSAAFKKRDESNKFSPDCLSLWHILTW